MIGLDSTAIIDLTRDEPNIRKKLYELNEQLATTVINQYEVFCGLTKKTSSEEKRFIESFFSELTVFTCNSAAVESGIAIRLKLLGYGSEASQMDMLIAGIFMTNGVTKIITRNVKHFEHIPGLKVITY